MLFIEVMEMDCIVSDLKNIYIYTVRKDFAKEFS
jgi:hypothetical protein